MPRYFFHLRDGDELYQDDEGDELPDDQAAREWALLNARSSLNDKTMSVGKWLRLIYEIRADDARLVGVVPFGAAIDTEMPR